MVNVHAFSIVVAGWIADWVADADVSTGSLKAWTTFTDLRQFAVTVDAAKVTFRHADVIVNELVAGAAGFNGLED